MADRARVDPNTQYTPAPGDLPKGDWKTSVGLQLGLQLGQFQIESFLGRGSMGEVWKAHDTIGNRSVVLKVVAPELARNPAELRQFREAFNRIHALQHQHICPVLMLLEDPSVGVYLVMKHVDGVDLRTWSQKRGPVSLNDVVQLLAPIAKALDHAHKEKVLHRDVKPENILLRHDKRDVQLIDFGLATEFRETMARLSHGATDFAGTRPFMAPELWRGRTASPQSDQYALGVTAYQLLSGRLPFDSADVVVLQRCILQEAAPKIQTAADATNAVLARVLAKTPEERFNSCAEFVSALSKTSTTTEFQPVHKPVQESLPKASGPPPLPPPTSTNVINEPQAAHNSAADRLSHLIPLRYLSIVAIAAVGALIVWSQWPPSPATTGKIDEAPAAGTASAQHAAESTQQTSTTEPAVLTDPMVPGYVKLMRRHFATLDVNRSGEIGPGEFAKALPGTQPGDKLRFFNRLDTDTNGGLNFKEFLATCYTVLVSRDSDGDQRLSETEFLASDVELSNVPRSRAGFARYDFNADGYVTLEELERVMALAGND